MRCLNRCLLATALVAFISVAGPARAGARDRQLTIRSASATGTTLSITGTNFGTPAPLVRLNGTALAVLPGATSAVVVATLPVPALAPGTYLLTAVRAHRGDGDEHDASRFGAFDVTIGGAGTQGPAGPQGPQGLAGSQGVQGPQGPAGPAAVGGIQGAVEPNLVVVRGTIEGGDTSNPIHILAGSGFTVSSPATVSCASNPYATYEVTFAAGTFSSPPSVVVSAHDFVQPPSTDSGINHPVYTVAIDDSTNLGEAQGGVTTNGFTARIKTDFFGVTCYGSYNWDFIAIGPR